MATTNFNVANYTEYKEFLRIVKARDGHRCRVCDSKGRMGKTPMLGPISVHHILPKHKYPQHIFNPDNGITLCGPCHETVNGCEWLYAPLLFSIIGTQIEDKTAMSYEQAVAHLHRLDLRHRENAATKRLNMMFLRRKKENQKPYPPGSKTMMDGHRFEIIQDSDSLEILARILTL